MTKDVKPTTSVVADAASDLVEAAERLLLALALRYVPNSLPDGKVRYLVEQRMFATAWDLVLAPPWTLPRTLAKRGGRQ